MAVNSLGYVSSKNPIAQSIYIDEPTGIFVTKIKLFFKSRVNPGNVYVPQVSVQLRPMRNGVPSITDIIPGSVVYLNSSAINVSADGSTGTDFVFDEPVFLDGLRDYAIVLYSEIPDYEVYISEIDKQIIGSNSLRVSKNPSIGSLFYSQNGATFTANQKQDLKFELYRAEFRHKTAEVILHNATLPRHKLTNNPMRVVNGASEVYVYLPGHGLTVGDEVAITGAVGFANIAASALNDDHTITKVDATGYEFDCGTNANADALGGGNAVQSLRNMPFSAIYPHTQLMLPGGTSQGSRIKTSTGKSFAGLETPYTKSANYNTIALNNTSYNLQAPQVVMADSIESVELAGGVKSLDLSIEMSSNNTIVSPIVDLQRSSISLIHNMIDKQDSATRTGFNTPVFYVGEEEKIAGSAAAKHITIPVKLREDAVGLKVILAANVPSACDYQLFYRTTTGDGDLREESFIEIKPETQFPKDDNPLVFREHEYLIGGRGGQLDAFSQYQLKIVMRSTNNARVPVFKDLRTIALAT